MGTSVRMHSDNEVKVAQVKVAFYAEVVKDYGILVLRELKHEGTRQFQSFRPQKTW